jgi:hypothetical protein
LFKKVLFSLKQGCVSEEISKARRKSLGLAFQKTKDIMFILTFDTLSINYHSPCLQQ